MLICIIKNRACVLRKFCNISIFIQLAPEIHCSSEEKVPGVWINFG